jgi:uncharacterized membrane protein YfcA
MIAYLVVCGTAAVVAALTLFSGFGLGTLLLPAFAIFFPVEVAVAATAVVHLANNVFKVFLLGRAADWRVVALFGLPAAVAAFAGAALLHAMAAVPPLGTWAWLGRTHAVTVVKLVIAALMLAFALFETAPAFRKLELPRGYLPVGGLLSGFFGGLSGHQGALRSAFLITTGLGKEGFIATGVVSAVIVDLSRLTAYGVAFVSRPFGTVLADEVGWTLIAGAIVAAFVGSFAGARLLPRVTMGAVRGVVAAMLVGAALALATGLV